MRVMRTVAAGTGLLAVLTLAGCRADMQDQPKFFPQRGTTMFTDGRSARPQVAGTVARSQMHADTYFYTGLIDGKEGEGLPIPLTAETIARGQERYNVYCTPCHSRVGNGQGMIVQRGYRPAGDFHTDRLRQAPLGHFFAVMTNGYGAMPDYSAQVTPADRWAIAAYIRALQLSQNATAADVPAGEQAEDLQKLAADKHMAAFAGPWKLPKTAIYGTPNGQDNGIPTATGAAGAKAPAAAAPAAATPATTAAKPAGETK